MNVTVDANLLWCLYVLAGAMAEQRADDDELAIVEHARHLLKQQAPAYLVMMEAAMDQDVALVRDRRRSGEAL